MSQHNQDQILEVIDQKLNSGLNYKLLCNSNTSSAALLSPAHFVIFTTQAYGTRRDIELNYPASVYA